MIKCFFFIPTKWWNACIMPNFDDIQISTYYYYHLLHYRHEELFCKIGGVVLSIISNLSINSWRMLGGWVFDKAGNIIFYLKKECSVDWLTSCLLKPASQCFVIVFIYLLGLQVMVYHSRYHSCWVVEIGAKVKLVVWNAKHLSMIAVQTSICKKIFLFIYLRFFFMYSYHFYVLIWKIIFLKIIY
jgi:hypothetical protein